MQVVLGLGTNLGDREGNLARALDALERLEGTELLRLSNIYETDPFDVLSQQDDYLNCCVLIETKLKPQRLLEHCLEIEKSWAGCGWSTTRPHHGYRYPAVRGVRFPDAGADGAPSPHPGKGLCHGAAVGPVPPAPGLWI